MYRKIMDFLETWKVSEHRKPLILQGAYQPRLSDSHIAGGGVKLFLSGRQSGYK